MDENHQDKTEKKLTEDKLTPSLLPLQDQRGTDQLQNNRVEDTIEYLRHHGYTITEEYSNTGQLLKISGEHPQRKTLWDWLQLLIIPLLIFFLGIGFTWVQNQTSLQIAQDNRAQDLQIAKNTQEEETLKSYLDDMTTLLLDKKLGSQAIADKVASTDAAVVARAKTLTALRRLMDGLRKATVVQFLYESHLIGYLDLINGSKQGPIINLSGANLSGANLSGAQVVGAHLNNVNLSGADLTNADLNSCDLTSIDLSGTDLANADLTNADLNSCNLTSADLSSAHLTFSQLNSAELYLADFKGAHLLGVQLRRANLVNADLTNANLFATALSNADLRYADFKGAHLKGTFMSFANLNDARDLTQQQLDEVSSCYQAKLPKGLVCHHQVEVI
jgi:uncharacterized protein YjbI with pentapeptide repeats